MSYELKPCKRCGGKAALVIDDSEHEYDWDWFIQCRTCCERTDTYDSIDKAISAWNTRADDAPKQPVDNAQADSREQLEEDAFELASTIWHKGCAWESGVEDLNLVGWKREDVIELLDRQAIITERELCEYFHMLDRTDELEAQVDNLTAELCCERKLREYAYNELNKILALDGKRVKQINELTAERNQLDRDLIAEHALVTQFEHDNEMLRGKLREKQHVCDVQRDSFAKMERENAELRKMLADAAEAI